MAPSIVAPPSPARLPLRLVAAPLLLLALMALAILLAAGDAEAVPSQPGVHSVEQPDGSTFRARRFGDEWYNGLETARGHTVLQRKDGWWVYAVKGARGSLRRSDAVVGRDAAPARRHLRDAGDVRRAHRMRSSATSAPDGAQGGPFPAPAHGPDKSLVILAQFADQSGVTTAAQWNAAYFASGPGVKSVRQFYSVGSGGQFEFVPAAESHGTGNDGVVGWVTLPMNHPNTQGSTDDRNRNLTKAAIEAANPFVDYASYDTNGDGVVTARELHVTVIVAGQEASCCSHLGKSVWGHRWALEGAQVPVVDGKQVGGWGYTQFGEMHGSHMATLGIMVHELGHDLELPDLYDYSGLSDGVGIWSLMSYGSWGGVASDPHGVGWGETPVSFDAWSRWFLGWITPQQVSGTQSTSINAATSGTAQVAVSLRGNPGGPHDWRWFGGGAGEYFLVENRQPTVGTYDAALPGSGLLVLHVDESRGNNASPSARLVDVEEADGLNELDAAGDDMGDAGDLYPGSANNRAFGPATNPNSNLRNGTPSGVSITGISNSGPSMSATFTAPVVTTPPANDSFAAATTIVSQSGTASGDNTHATKEAGEPDHGGNVGGASVWWRWNAPINGQVTIETDGSAASDTVLAVYTGEAVSTLTPVASNDDLSDTDLHSRVTFAANAGTTYRIAVDSFNNGTGNAATRGGITLSWNQPDPTTDPRDVTVDLTPEARAGHPFAYVVTAARTGQADPAAVNVTVTLPATVEPLVLPAGCTGDPVVTCNLGVVAPGGDASRELLVVPLSPGPHSASAALVSTDEVPAGNTDLAEAGPGVVCDNAATDGADVVGGTDAEEVLCGLGGNDRVAGSGGSDLIFGGAGTDTLTYAAAPDAMNVDLRAQTLAGPTAWPVGGVPGVDPFDFATGFEAAEGSAFADHLTGRTGSDQLLGLGGADLVVGGGGADLLRGGAANDKLSGGGGNDRLYGEAGNDRLDGGAQRDLCRDPSDVRVRCER